MQAGHVRTHTYTQTCIHPSIITYIHTHTYLTDMHPHTYIHQQTPICIHMPHIHICMLRIQPTYVYKHKAQHKYTYRHKYENEYKYEYNLFPASLSQPSLSLSLSRSLARSLSRVGRLHPPTCPCCSDVSSLSICGSVSLPNVPVQVLKLSWTSPCIIFLCPLPRIAEICCWSHNHIPKQR